MHLKYQESASAKLRQYWSKPHMFSRTFSFGFNISFEAQLYMFAAVEIIQIKNSFLFSQNASLAYGNKLIKWSTEANDFLFQILWYIL